jgi:hypothetical protein
MVIHVHQGKGSRDSDVPMPAKLLETLRLLLALEEAESLSVPQYRRPSG